MRKSVSILLAFLLTASLLAGCQKTPEEPVVIKKDTEQLIEAASGDDESKKINSIIFPDRFVSTFHSVNNSITVNADAEIVSLSREKFPVSRIKAGDFSQGNVNSFVQEFLSGAEMVNADTRTATDYQLHSIEVEAIGRGHTVETVLGLNITENTGSPDSARTLLVKNGSDISQPDTNTTPGMVYAQKGASLEYADTRLGKDRGMYQNIRRVSGENDSPDDTNGLLNLTPNEAQERVEAILARMGISFAVTDVWLTGEGRLDTNGNFITPPTRYAYQLRCSSTKSGAPCIYLPMAMGLSSEDYGGTWGFWPYEEMTVLIDDEGVFYLRWQTPLDIVETVSENAQLMSFDKIENIFNKMMLVKYEYYEFSRPVESLSMTVDRAVLGLFRIAEKNATDTGLLVPVWCFYGTRTVNCTDGYVSAYDSDMGAEPLIIINAVDGTIIDYQLGY